MNTRQELFSHTGDAVDVHVLSDDDLRFQARVRDLKDSYLLNSPRLIPSDVAVELNRSNPASEEAVRSATA